MNCSTDNSFPWPGLQSNSLPEWNPIPDELPKPRSVNNFQSLETTHTISKSAHKIQSTKKTSQRSRERWTSEDDLKVLEGVKIYGLDRAWKKIAHNQFFDTKSNIQISQRYREYLDPNLYHGPFRPEEVRNYLQVEERAKKSQRVYRMSDYKKKFNKNLKPGQYRSRVDLIELQLKLNLYRKNNEIPSPTSTTSFPTLGEGSLPRESSVPEKEIEAFIRFIRESPKQPRTVMVKKKKNPLVEELVIRWSKEEDAQLRKAVKKYGKKWVEISNSEMLERSADECSKRWQGYLDPAFDHSPPKPGEKERMLAIYERAKRNSRNLIDWQDIEDRFNNNQEAVYRRNKYYLRRLYENIKRSQKNLKRKSEPVVDREVPTKKQEISPAEFNVPLTPELLEHKDNSSNLLSSAENLQPINPFLINSQFFLWLTSSLQQLGTMGSYGT